ncbi:DUF2779 domain-containing protein [Acidisoma sp. S159]|uniref:DUF2779 domain-containing protein n=1 Tax=Acidisoma sp. S159 TaxID=1747225 RepID=UPI00131ACBA3|nr:DUF2779 domain-containing protein [Acidisoma sp. S159]
MAGLNLTKSRYAAGLQCSRRLWLLIQELAPYDDLDPGASLDVGQEIGRKAHLLFPGGILVEEAPWQHAAAVRRTLALMADPSVPALFEAAFEHDGVRIRVDVLERLAGGAWGLREVKSGTRMSFIYVQQLDRGDSDAGTLEDEGLKREDFRLTPKQTIIRDATASGRPYVASDLARLLKAFRLPACYLDFEAMMPPIPLYAGTRPYQTIPFQWSLHAIDGNGALHHREFLAEGDEDPRLAFAETLIAILNAFDGPILVYSAYEQTQLRELAKQFPQLRAPIEAIIARIRDLLPIVRAAVYFPAFGFSNSIKAVAPGLCPGFGYDDLVGIANGTAASAAFVQLASGYVPDPEEVGRLRRALLAYCQRDTLAMVEVHRALMELAVAEG